MDKYEALVAIDYEPTGQEAHHKHFQPGDVFVYPDDVQTPDGSVMDIEGLVEREAVRRVTARRRTTTE